MADRRMFAKTITDSDAFCDMPHSTQNLYFHLCMRADDDGFVNNPKKIQRTIGCSDDDARILCAKSFILPFESGVIVIKHWRMHNAIRKDRYKTTVYQDEKNQLEIKPNGAYTYKDGLPNGNQLATIGIPDGNQMATQVRLGKVNKNLVDLGKSTLSKNDYSESFLDFYESYPRKEGKSAAQKAYKKNVKTDADHSSLLRALEVYKTRLQRDGTETKYIKLPGTFLGCFSDYLEEPKAETPKKRVEEKCECCGAEGWMLDDFCRKCGHQRGTPVTDAQIAKGKAANG